LIHYTDKNFDGQDPEQLLSLIFFNYSASYIPCYHICTPPRKTFKNFFAPQPGCIIALTFCQPPKPVLADSQNLLIQV